MGYQAPSHPQFMETLNECAIPFQTSAWAALYYFVANICSACNILHKPCLLGSPRRVSPNPLCAALHLKRIFCHHTAAIHRWCYAGKYLTTSSQGKALFRSVGQFPWCKYLHCSQFQVIDVRPPIIGEERHTTGPGEPERACSSPAPSLPLSYVFVGVAALSCSLYHQ